jgi:hypothetical protein
VTCGAPADRQRALIRPIVSMAGRLMIPPTRSEFQ